MTPAVDAIDSLFNASSIALIGASNDPGKWGYQYAESLLRSREQRSIYLVNRNRSTILGERSFASCAELPSSPLVAIVCVPAAKVEAAVLEALAAGAKFIVCITAGFAEVGHEGAAVQRRIVEEVRSHGARLIGPNCLGFFDFDAKLECTSFWRISSGPIGLVSQSGTVVLELGTRLAEVNLGLSRGISIGNQADLAAFELVETFQRSASTEALVVYLEDLQDVRSFFGALESVRRADTPCVLLTPGSSEATTRAVSSHTASMLTSDEIIDAMCADTGIRRARSIGAVIRHLRGILSPTPLRGTRIAIVADGGGGAVLAADACVSAGLEVPRFSADLQAILTKNLMPGSGCQNPVDTVGALCLGDMRLAIEAALRSDEIDGVLLAGALNNVGRMSDAEDRQTSQLIFDAAVQSGKGLAVASMWPAMTAVAELARQGVPVGADVVEVANIFRAGIEIPVRRSVSQLPPPTLAAQTGDGYFAARRLFAELGVPFLRAEEVANSDEAVRVANLIGFPVVLKALGSLHKSDAGGVILDIRDSSALRQHVDRLSRQLNPTGFSVEAMATNRGIELIVGSVRQPRVGPIVVVGAGGTLTEVLRDKVVALAPVDAEYAAGMLERLRIAHLFPGYRNRPRIDVSATAKVIASFSNVLFNFPQMEEAEMNPLLASEAGTVALDARFVLTQS